jgi:predicted MPP superfamily phosphohydrolase
MSILKKIQVISDIHIEFRKAIPLIPKLADTLFLAGDIGKIDTSNFKPFFDYISKNWKQTFYVLGNHEFYSEKIDISSLTNKYIDFFKQYDNITLLNRNKVEYEGYQILGCTLWSNTTADTRYLNDFVQIKKNSMSTAGISLNDFISFHNEDLHWLKENYDKSKPTIIITHFPLISTLNEQRLSHPKYDDQDPKMASYFMNNIHLESENTLLCISGHTHYSHDFIRNGIRYISNQLGHIGELTESGYQDKLFYIE